MSFLPHNYLSILLHLEYYYILLKHIWTVISPNSSQSVPWHAWHLLLNSFCSKRSDQAPSKRNDAFKYEYKCMDLQWSLGCSFCPGTTWLYLGWRRRLYSVLLLMLVVAHTGLDGLLCWAPPFMSRRVSCVISASRRRQHQAWKDRIIYPSRFFRTVLHAESIQTLIHDTSWLF